MCKIVDKKEMCKVIEQTKKSMLHDVPKIMPGSPEYMKLSQERQKMINMREGIGYSSYNSANTATAQTNFASSDSPKSIVPKLQPVALPNNNLQQNYISCCNPTTNSFSFEITGNGVTELNTGISCNFHIEITKVYILLGDDNSPADTSVLQEFEDVRNNSGSCQALADKYFERGVL